MNDIASFVLCQTDQPVNISNRETCLNLVNAMCRQARQSLHIFSNSCDPELFNTSEFIDAVRHIITTNSNATVRVLFHSLDALTHGGHTHRLIELAQRLGSHKFFDTAWDSGSRSSELQSLNI